jgi:hypothetical protein
MTTIEPERGDREQLLATVEELQVMVDLIEKYPAEAQLIMAAAARVDCDEFTQIGSRRSAYRRCDATSDGGARVANICSWGCHATERHRPADVDPIQHEPSGSPGARVGSISVPPLG